MHSQARAASIGQVQTITLGPSAGSTCCKAVGVAVSGILLAYLIQHPPAFIMTSLHEVRLNMTSTVAEYPEYFSAPRQYDQICDTHSNQFWFGNIEFLEARGDFELIHYFSIAGFFNMACDLFKALTAVLMQPVAVVPNADEFEFNEAHHNDLSMRRSPTSHFVTLGNLVPEADLLWQHHGRDIWEPTDDAKELIALVNRFLPDGSRRVGAEFTPIESVCQLMNGPHYVQKIIMMPWTLKTAWLFFPIQFTQLVWELFAESFIREPTPFRIIMNSILWKRWVALSFRHEVLLPALLRLLRCYISVDNLRSFFRGDPKGENLGIRIALTMLLMLVSLPQLMVYFPAMAMTLLVGLGPTWMLCYALSGLGGPSLTYWPKPYHHHMPSMLIAVPCALVSAFAVGELFRFLSSDTYICTHSRAMLVPIHSGKVLINAPMVFFALSMVFCAVGVIVPIWMLRRLTPRSCRLASHIMSPEYIYMQWLKSPLYDGRAIRNDETNYCNHKKKHFFVNDPTPSRCKYCAHLREEKLRTTNQRPLPQQAVIYIGRGLAWEPPCLCWLKAQAQRGEICAAEFKLGVEAMSGKHQPEDLVRALATADEFHSALHHAEGVRHRMSAPCSAGAADEGARVDGSMKSLLRSLRSFLKKQQRDIGADDFSSSDGDEDAMELEESSNLNFLAPFLGDDARMLQQLLKKEGFYHKAVDGEFDSVSIRSLQAWLLHKGFALDKWMRDEDGVWGQATITSLQKFLKTEEAGHKWKVSVVDGDFAGRTVITLQEFLSDSGELVGTTLRKTVSDKTLRGLKHVIRKRGYLDKPCGDTRCKKCQQDIVTIDYSLARPCSSFENHTDEDFKPGSERRTEWTSALKSWLRDEGFPSELVLRDASKESYTGKWDEATTMAFQQFLNSSRATTSAATALSIDGDFNSRTSSRLREFLVSESELTFGERPSGGNGWDGSAKRLLQLFLLRRSYYADFVDGAADSPATVRALQAWLCDEGFLVQKDEEWGTLTTRAIQMFLNSARASARSAHSPLDVDGRFASPTVTSLQRFLIRCGEDPGPIDHAFTNECRQALVSFLTRTGYPVAADGQEGQDLAQALQQFLTDKECFNNEAATILSTDHLTSITTLPQTLRLSETSDDMDDREPDFPTRVVQGLQVFLNSPEAQGVGRSRLHVSLCWCLALFGGAEEHIPEEAVAAIRWLNQSMRHPDYLKEGAKATTARSNLREEIHELMEKAFPTSERGLQERYSKDSWWGVAELLQCLGCECWLQSAGPVAGRAALGALKSLAESEEARPGTWNAAIVTLVGRLGIARPHVVPVVAEVLVGFLTPEEVRAVVRALKHRLLRDTTALEAVCEALAVFRDSEAFQEFVRGLPAELEVKECSRLQRVAQAIGGLSRVGLAPASAAEQAASELASRLVAASGPASSSPTAASAAGASEKVFLCRAVPSLGAVGASRCKDLIIELIEKDAEGIVVGTAGQAIGAMLATESISLDAASRAAGMLAWRLSGSLAASQSSSGHLQLQQYQQHRHLLQGACMGLGALGAVAAAYVPRLEELFTESQDRAIVEAAGAALVSLHRADAVGEQRLSALAAAAEVRMMQQHSSLPVRISACAGLASVSGALSRKNIDLIRMRMAELAELSEAELRNAASEAYASFGSV